MSSDSFSLATVGLFASAAWTLFFAAVYVSSAPAAQRKLLLWPFAIFRFVVSTDLWWKKSTIDAALKLRREVRRKKIYFIRHAESQWNVLFNRGFGISFFPNLIQAIVEEVQLLPTGDSIFIDSALSTGGIAQSISLKNWIETMSSDPSGLFLKSGEPGKVAFCCSNLRRTASTAAIALSGRLLRFKDERIHALSCMQELTRNFDGVALAVSGNPPRPSPLERTLPELQPVVGEVFSRFEGVGNNGTQPLYGYDGLNRFNEWCKWCFDSPAARDKHTIVATGHSLWVREFMKTFLPCSNSHNIKKSKIVNCGVVSFDLVDCGDGEFAVDPNSIRSVVGGFEGKENGYGVEMEKLL